jgi:Flp pilus assembly protein TadG
MKTRELRMRVSVRIGRYFCILTCAIAFELIEAQTSGVEGASRGPKSLRQRAFGYGFQKRQNLEQGLRLSQPTTGANALVSLQVAREKGEMSEVGCYIWANKWLVGRMTARTTTRDESGHALVVYSKVHANRDCMSLFVTFRLGDVLPHRHHQLGMRLAPVSLPPQWPLLGMKPLTELRKMQTPPAPRDQSHLRRRLAILGPASGQSILEMALVLPILLLLLVGTIEIGRFAYYSILVASAARAGAQYGAQNLATAADKTGIQTAALNDGQNVTGLTVPTATIQQLCGCNGSSLSTTCPATGCAKPEHPLVYIQVQAQGTFSSLFSYPGIPASITINSMEKMRVAQ